MIQRVQTLWLLAASACAFLTLKLSFYSGNKLVENKPLFSSLTAMNNIPILILTVAVAIAALVIIFLYKDRKMQIRLTLATAVISILIVVLYFLQTKKFIPDQGNYDFTAFFPFLVPVFLFLAARGIYRDQKLIKSVDRLR
ncbi:DUF4293 domain-containing protein [Foetidibacter luteolus]|uniref:DUF4293 domain-containing protein n=1 Tax=Foetidibacter luteolus TaxID=2608880 RepID=UPI00129BA8FE|nr:DUF4293 domain-containing protein [Foetidibacter luteolus]